MKVKLIKQFGNKPKGEEFEANETLCKHLLTGGFIARPKDKKAK
jgi:hypothetical protein